MIKRKEIWVAECHESYQLEPSDTTVLFYSDIYGDTYRNDKDYWTLIEVGK